MIDFISFFSFTWPEWWDMSQVPTPNTTFTTFWVVTNFSAYTKFMIWCNAIISQAPQKRASHTQKLVTIYPPSICTTPLVAWQKKIYFFQRGLVLLDALQGGKIGFCTIPRIGFCHFFWTRKISGWCRTKLQHENFGGVTRVRCCQR